MKKIILDEESEKAFNIVCDAALKGLGGQVFGAVKKLVDAIIEEPAEIVSGE